MLDADLDTLLTGLYFELDNRIIPASRHGRTRRGPGRPRLVTDAELVCLAVVVARRCCCATTTSAVPEP